MHIYRLSEPIDDFDGLIPPHEWIEGSPGRLAWALQAVLALSEAALTIGWKGDMRHLPLIGYFPTSPFVTRYLLVKQDNNGDTFLICDAEPSWLIDQPATGMVTPGRIGAWVTDRPRQLPTQRARARCRVRRHRLHRAGLLNR
jgi:hypothetical protein